MRTCEHDPEMPGERKSEGMLGGHKSKGRAGMSYWARPAGARSAHAVHVAMRVIGSAGGLFERISDDIRLNEG